jgi:hypothetical protein
VQAVNDRTATVRYRMRDVDTGTGFDRPAGSPLVGPGPAPVDNSLPFACLFAGSPWRRTCFNAITDGGVSFPDGQRR